MGNLLRRYWTPALLSAELPDPDGTPVRTRLLGEDLVAFRASDGRVGLIAQACPHRGASLFFGRNEENGIRCIYHGWKYDLDGRCVDMPSEPAETNFSHKIIATAYPTHESGGIIWTYMGPRDKMTGFRDFGSDSVPKEEWRATKIHSTCNWIQGLEGNIDTAHISWLHQYFGIRDIPEDGTDRPGYPSGAYTWKIWLEDRAPRIEVQDTWYGFRYAGLRTTPNGHTHARVTDYIMPYMSYIASIPVGSGGGILMVPIDDNSFWRYNIAMRRPERVATPNTNRPPSLDGRARSPYVQPTTTANGIIQREWVAENDYQIDREFQKTEAFSGIRDFVSQDLAVTESMGPIYDRRKEHLGTTDKAIIALRRLLIRTALEMEDGVEPPAVDPELPYRSIRSAEKILDRGEDWRYLGTEADPILRNG
jgi:phenylpropionate dioxygenase-like ring-hydroxylating dioxygenase large terminal subunit